ncbi:hypothetical protein NLJ89_g6596 [Agrocybe chaxingu]|uniref:Phosphoglycerate mutase-like protein n=1 Tax=Agrocybe chaxingu TaxID=84603 RepID=A0A9W8JYB4_9AGAR|nr:hypothetical protein NLJ89_g6596 [Agrocybe chaxingu]
MGIKAYEPVQGYFVHDDPSQLPLPAVPPRFGLKDDSEDRWAKLLGDIRKLNENAPEGTSYKFFLLSRHGQGYHNVAEAKYGTIAWDDYWAKLDGDGEIIWGPDPKLTPVGIEQAHAVRAGWITESQFGIPAPHKRYCSPLTRALHTCDTMFDGVYEKYEQRVFVMEHCREENGVHTCDKRNTRTHIGSSFPDFAIEDSLTEHDELWHATIRETKPEVADRARKVLNYIFDHDREHTFISITAHGGWITGFLTAVGSQPFVVPTGGNNFS